MAATSKPLSLASQSMYIRPAHFNLPKVDLLTKSTAKQAVYRLAQQTKHFYTCFMLHYGSLHHERHSLLRK
jgi:hypothetical protein